ncbi:MAG TPA: hypothetical protein VGT79_09505 [Xanthomonadaceae bacterium]|nr:hypothetical protein [Xanthomonadaceae bacterium]
MSFAQNIAVDFCCYTFPMLQQLANTMSLKGVLDGLRPCGWEHADHWQQGEFHDDVVVRLNQRPPEVEGNVLVVSTNCNGGVKEVLCLDAVPDRWGLWHYRCPDNPEFEGPTPHVRGFARTTHWFDPCNLLKPGTRGEYLEEYRKRQRGGGYTQADSTEE